MKRRNNRRTIGLVLFALCLPMIVCAQKKSGSVRPGGTTGGGTSVSTTSEAEYQFNSGTKTFTVIPKSSGSYTGTIQIKSTSTYVTRTDPRTGAVISSETYPVTVIGGSAFQNCSLYMVSIASSITTIGSYAFDGTSFSRGTQAIPSSVVSIGDYAFRNIDVGTLEMRATTPPTIPSNTFGSPNTVAGKTILSVPTGYVNVYRNASVWGDFKTITDGTTTSTNNATVTANNFSIKYGDDIPTLTYTTTGKVSGKPTLSCNATKASKAGSYTITVGQGTLLDYYTRNNGKLTIEKAPLTISAGTYTMRQGEAMPVFAATYEGFKNGETSEVLTSQPVFSCAANADSEPGEYPVTIAQAQADNYAISYVQGKLIIKEKPVTITAKSYTRKYGEQNPLFEYTAAGGTLRGTPVVACNATEASPVGTYPIVVSQGTVANEEPTFITGYLTIEKASLTVSAGNYTVKEGSALPTFIPSYLGFVNGEDAAALTTQPTIVCNATSSSPVGEYPILIYGAGSGNYEMTYVSGTLTIEPASNSLAIDAASVAAGSVLSLPVQLNNESEVTAFQFDLTLPDGITVKSIDSSARLDESHQLRWHTQTDGTVRVIGFSRSLKAISGDSGSLITVNADVAADVVSGTYPVQFGNLRLSTSDAKAFALDDLSVDVSVTGKMNCLGDVNNDGIVTITDAVAIINYTLENEPAVFNRTAADVNGDGVITITDAVSIVNMTLSDE